MPRNIRKNPYPQVGALVEWETLYCDQRRQYQGKVLEFVQKKHVLWAIVERANKTTIQIQANRIFPLQVTSNENKVVTIKARSYPVGRTQLVL